MIKKVIILGSGGHAISCYELISKLPKIKFSGFCSKETDISKTNKIFSENEILKNPKKFENLVNGIGHLKDNTIRKKLFFKFKKKGFKFPIIKSKNSIISDESEIDEGTQIFNHVIVNSKVQIGKNCIINNKSLIEHDVKIGDHCHISTGVIINGSVKIGNNCFIGSGSVLSNNIKIKDNSFIKMGSLIKR
tara:strand:+ start:908 stop:1480 length:573 start_codon:yes stop_codon:yes gene_type:complete